MDEKNLTVKVDAALLKRIKIRAAQEDMTMQQFVVALLKEGMSK